MKRAGIEIRPLEIDDLHGVFILGQDLFSEKNFRSLRAWDEKVLAEILPDNLEISFIAVRKKSVAGFLIGAVSESGTRGATAKILWLGIQRLEKKDTGHDLIEAFIARCAGKNIADLLFEVPGTDSELIDLCRKSGFTQTGQVLIMERLLPEKK
jgi:hypothetical protein